MRADYMEKRTMERKEYDLKCLFEMVEEYPDDPRHIYYIAQTYNLLDKHELAAEYFKKRAFHPNKGLEGERYDALFEMTRLYDYTLKRPWSEVEPYYLMLEEWDSERTEASYFLGVHYYLANDKTTAYKWFKKSFALGYPVHKQYGLKLVELGKVLRRLQSDIQLVHRLKALVP